MSDDPRGEIRGVCQEGGRREEMFSSIGRINHEGKSMRERRSGHPRERLVGGNGQNQTKGKELHVIKLSLEKPGRGSKIIYKGGKRFLHV